MKKRLYFVLAVMTGFLASGTTPLRATAEDSFEAVEPAGGSKQCYHYTWENPSACSTCSNSCLGSGYVCCSIVVG